MKTKLVYVLTCAPEATYIEQAMMAIWSARYWNPDAYIVLLTDDKTSNILHTDKVRGEVLQYISEEIVTPFNEKCSMMYRSRWLKTKARELVVGDMLFVDSDTICCRSLDGVDQFACIVGAVLESHLPIAELADSMQYEIENEAIKIGWSIKTETFYFSSGVLFTRDVKDAHSLYQRWHDSWMNGIKSGVNIDQPSLAYANIQSNHIIEIIPNSYNCILFTEPQHTQEAHILHIAAYRNPSILFEKNTLLYIREHGLNDENIKNMIIHPCYSFKPFDYDILHSNFVERVHWIGRVASLVGGKFNAIIWMVRKRIHVLRHRSRIKDNYCRR